MIRFVFLTLLVSFMSLTTYVKGEPCYVVIESTGSYEELVVSSLSVNLLKKYIDPTIKLIPMSGISEKTCQYRINVTEKVTGVSVYIFGDKITDHGTSELRSEKGLKQSLLRSIFKGIQEELKREEVCREFQELLNKECINYKSSHSLNITKKTATLSFFPGYIKTKKKSGFIKKDKEHRVIESWNRYFESISDKITITHSNYIYIHKSSEDIGRYGDIKKKIWKNSFNFETNDSLIFELGDKIGTDYVFTFVMEPFPGKKGGRFILYLFDIRSKTKFFEKGRWKPNQLWSSSFLSLSSFMNRVFDVQ